jgi:hypothetical protein
MNGISFIKMPKKVSFSYFGLVLLGADIFQPFDLLTFAMFSILVNFEIYVVVSTAQGAKPNTTLGSYTLAKFVGKMVSSFAPPPYLRWPPWFKQHIYK